MCQRVVDDVGLSIGGRAFVAAFINRDAKSGIRRNVRAYHFVEAWVDLAGTPRRVVVTIREDNNGAIYYNHGLPDAPRGTDPTPRNAGGESSWATSGIGSVGDGLNLDVRPDGTRGRTLEREGFAGASARVAAHDDRPTACSPEPESSASQDTSAGDGLNLEIGRDDTPGRTLEQSGPDPKGSITSLPDGQTLLRLFQGTDLSTVLHEAGPSLLETLANLDAKPDAPAALRQDGNGAVHSNALRGTGSVRAMHVVCLPKLTKPWACQATGTTS